MQESTSLLILWLLSSLKQERSTLCLIQMLECPAAQAEIALHRVTADGLAEPVSYTHLTLPTICSV